MTAVERRNKIEGGDETGISAFIVSSKERERERERREEREERENNPTNQVGKKATTTKNTITTTTTTNNNNNNTNNNNTRISISHICRVSSIFHEILQQDHKIS